MPPLPPTSSASRPTRPSWREPRARTAAATALGLVAAGAFVLAPAADAEPQNQFTASKSVARNCFAAPVPQASGVDRTRVTATETGLVRVRLDGGGDWDVAVFDSATNRTVAASAGMKSHELAEGFVTKDQKLLVQACRYGGSARSVGYNVSFVAVPAAAAGTAQLVSVATPDRTAKRRLQALGVDLTESATKTSIDAVLTKADAAKVTAAGFRYTVKIADLAKHAAANRAADRAFAKAQAASALPSGRTSYRRLADYEFEMKELARKYPKRVRAFTLSERTIEGREIGAIEIAKDAKNLADGKPIFLNMGVHHAREWPSGEHALEWAYDLVLGYGKNARTRQLVDASRNIVLPIVNPDAFTISREAPALGDFSTFDYEMKRKNCNPADSPEQFRTGICSANPAGRLRGTDLNRNYGGFWGGPGASTNWSSDTYRGSAPFSEPEVKAVRSLVSNRQVTNLITNHTFSNLILRPPGLADARAPEEEPLIKALGDKMASRNGYASQQGFQLYDTTGTTEDWSYWITGGLGYTFEIGPDSFHPAYEAGVVNEYLGLGEAAGAGTGGNQAAYYDMLEATIAATHHATLVGTAPRGWTLRVHKEFQTPTSPVIQPDGTTGDAILYSDTLDSTMKATGGAFSWAVNPSTRPYVAGRFGRHPTGPPQAPATLPNPAGQPAENQGDPLGGAHEEVPFTIAGPPDVDNGSATIHIEWGSTDTDWDLYIVDEAGTIVAQSAAGGTSEENAVMRDPLPGNYKAILVNYDQVEGQPYDDWSGGSVTFASPLPPTAGVKEAWTLTCERPDGSIASVRQVIVDRGQTADLGNVCARRSRAAKGVTVGR